MAKPARRTASSKPSPRPHTKSGTSERPATPPPTRALTAHQERQQRSSYVSAIALYERAVQHLQQHQYREAADLLRQVIATFPDERELLDRSRLYIGFCERHLTPPATEPGNTAERLYAATLALNAGRPDEAISYLRRVTADEPGNDRALYLLAVAYSARSEPGVAIRYLQQAIKANPENRSQARVDPDLEALRAVAGTAALLRSGSREPGVGR